MLPSTSRLESLLQTSTIGVSLNDITNFELTNLKNVVITNCPELPQLRLGKLIERVFAFLIQSSTNYTILKENLQIIDGKQTIGELDFIIQNTTTQCIHHLEIVYKFYIYDDSYSEVELEKWIGPNRKDSFIEKYNRLKTKQFPLLYKQESKPYLYELDISKITQSLCFMANLFIPFPMLNQPFPKVNSKTIVGYWLNHSDFINKHSNTDTYFLPTKINWGINPKFNTRWLSFSEVNSQIKESLQRQFSPLCWIKKSESNYQQCFIVWW